MMIVAILVMVMVAFLGVRTSQAASIIVAAHDSGPRAREHADLVCDGVNDEEELLASIVDYASTYSVDVDTGPERTIAVTCYGRHSVQWLPGTYILGAPLIIPNASDCVIQAEGTQLVGPPGESAVIVRGMNRCRYYFGAISCNAGDNPDAAALKVEPTSAMPAVMSKVGYTGLSGIANKGVGLHVDPGQGNVSFNEFAGTNVSNLDTGILVDEAQEQCKSNWFWASFVVHVNQCVVEKGHNVETNTWNVNVEAIEPDSIAVRTAAAHGKWYIILGTGDWVYRRGISETKSLILDPGAEHNVMEFHPAIEAGFAPWVDNSGTGTNVILTTKRPPYAPASSN